MKAFTTVFLFLAGLLTICTARNIDVDNDQVQGSSSSEESAELMRHVCYEKTGSNQVFEAIGAWLATAPVCTSTQIDWINFKNDLDRLKANASTRHGFFSKYCPQIRNALPCFEQPIKEFSKCLDDEDILLVHGTYNATPEALDLICENDGELLFQEGASIGVCITNLNNYLEQCVRVVSDSTNIVEVSKFSEAQCGELAQFRDCVKRKFNECNGPRLMDVFNVFWRNILKNNPC